LAAGSRFDGRAHRDLNPEAKNQTGPTTTKTQTRIPTTEQRCAVLFDLTRQRITTIFPVAQR
jgi:hypothetical protein